MARIKTVTRLRKCLRKPPVERSEADINLVLQATSTVMLFQAAGPQIHREICLAMKHIYLRRGESMSITEMSGGRACYLVLHGRLRMQLNNKGGGKEGGGGADEKVLDVMPSDSGVSTEQLKTLFNTIDKDGSGGIDLEEILEICDVLGLKATEEEMQEMLEAADADQDGVLNYEEFLTIMDQFGVTASSGSNQWVVKEDGTLETEMATGASFGEESIQGERPLRATITALKNTDLIVLDGSDYGRIMADGFSKIDVLQELHSVQTLLTRTELNPVATVTKSKQFTIGQHICSEGSPAERLYFIVSGDCTIMKRRKTRSIGGSLVTSGQNILRGGPIRAALPQRRLKHTNVEVGILGAGDFFGEESLVEGGGTHRHTIAAKGFVQVLMLNMADAFKLIHEEDIEGLLQLSDSRKGFRDTQFFKASKTIEKQSVELAEYKKRLAERLVEGLPEEAGDLEDSVEDGKGVREGAKAKDEGAKGKAELFLRVERDDFSLPRLDTFGRASDPGFGSSAGAYFGGAPRRQSIAPAPAAFSPAIAQRHATVLCRKFYDEKLHALMDGDESDRSAEKRALAGRFSDGFNPELAFGQNNRSWSMDGIQLAREESTESLPPIFSKIHKQSTLFPVTKPRKKVNKRKQGNFVRIRRPDSRDTAPSEADSSLFLGIISQQSRPSLA